MSEQNYNLFFRLNDSFTFQVVKDAARVRDFGEVFTPLKFVNEMLDMLPNNRWADASCTFIEPACGDGAFIIPVIHRRYLSHLKVRSSDDAAKKPLAQRQEAIALALNSVWGLDIQKDNVDECRANLLRLVIQEIPLQQNKSGKINSRRTLDFIGYCAAVIEHQIREGNGLESWKITKRCFEALPRPEKINKAQSYQREFALFTSGTLEAFSRDFINHVFIKN